MSVTHVTRLDLRFAPVPWPFADQRRAEIDEFFAVRQRANPKLWNGRVLVLHRWQIQDDVLHGAFLETDYASFHTWLAWDRPDAGVLDCFGAAAVLSSDGAFLLGRMAAHTANAGRIYCPCGTPDLSDIVGEQVDFDHSIARELAEETGLDAGTFDAEPGWTIVQERARITAYKVLRAGIAAQALRTRVESHIAADPEGELTGACMVRSPADLDPAMPAYVTTFLRHRWS
jgi:hypothetical protein